MMLGRTARTLVLGSCTAFAVVGCSSSDDTAACDEILNVLTQGSDAITAAATDPATASDALRGVATDLRSAADGASDAVVSSAGDLATIYEDMADSFENGEIPDVAGLEEPATALQEACS